VLSKGAGQFQHHHYMYTNGHISLLQFIFFWFLRFVLTTKKYVGWCWRGSYQLSRRCYWNDSRFHIFHTFFNHSKVFEDLEDIRVCFSFFSIVL
jgi:hypothetical protein